MSSSTPRPTIPSRATMMLPRRAPLLLTSLIEKPL
jgi:hypothetical protein